MVGVANICILLMGFMTSSPFFSFVDLVAHHFFQINRYFHKKNLQKKNLNLGIYKKSPKINYGKILNFYDVLRKISQESIAICRVLFAFSEKVQSCKIHNCFFKIFAITKTISSFFHFFPLIFPFNPSFPFQ